MFLKNAWYLAAWAKDISEKPLARRLLNEPVVLYRDAQGRATALADFCCHRGAPLSCGTVVESGIECGYHGMVYGRDGAVVHIPGQVHIPPKARTRSYPIVEKDEMIWIWMGEPALADPAGIVDYPFHNDHANWPHQHEMYHLKGSAMLMVDNLMDLTHLAYVHRTTIGGNAKAHVEAIMETTPTETGLKYTRWMLNTLPPPTYLKAIPFAGKVDRWQEFEWIAPGSIVQWTGAVDENTGARDEGKRDGGFHLRIFHGLTPETETSCFYFWSGANGYRQNEPQATRDLFAELTTAFKEDVAIVEQQQARLDEFGETGLVGMRNDGARVHMRRVIEKMMERETREKTPA